MACHHHGPAGAASTPVRSIAAVVGFLHESGFRRHPSGERPRFVRGDLEIEIGHVLTVIQFKDSPAGGVPSIQVADWMLMLSLDNPLPLLRHVVDHPRATTPTVPDAADLSDSSAGAEVAW